MTSSVFPDVNVWLALSSRDHRHFASAWEWYQALPPHVIPVFSRMTQLSFLRLLTTEAVMGRGTLSQLQAWEAYDRWRAGDVAGFVDEPREIEIRFRARTQSPRSSAKEWADAYLAAFAEIVELTLVTFDKALAEKARGAVLLGQ